MFVRLRSFPHIKSYMKCTWMCTKNGASLTQSLTLVPQSLCQSRVDIFSVLSTFLFIHILLYTQRAKKVCACVFDLCHVLTYIWCVGSFWCAQPCVFKTSHQFVWQNIQLKGLLNRTDRRHCEMKCLQLGCEMCHFFSMPLFSMKAYVNGIVWNMFWRIRYKYDVTVFEMTLNLSSAI